MVVQLQTGGDTPWSQAVYADPADGVTLLQIRSLMVLMYGGAKATGEFPNSCLTQLRSSIIEMSQKIKRFPPLGVITGANIERVKFKCQACEYRIDLENKRGHNLRR
jgi:hypothetical protein